jgi:hypothetical protein
MNTKQTLKIATIVAITGAFMLMAALANTPAHAKISQVTRCDGNVGSCPGKSSDPGQGHDETTQNENPSGHAPPGQN